MNSITAHPLFGLLLTIGVYALARHFYIKLKHPLLNPIGVSLCVIVATLTLGKIPLQHYMNGGRIISALLPLTVTILAIPLYRQIDLLKAHKKAILAGITAGVLTSIVSIILMGWLLGLKGELIRALLPKSITSPLGIEMSRMLHALEPIAVIAIVITGTLGTLVYPIAFRLFKITHPVAKGTAMGCASHAVGTSKALELGETEGAMSSLAIIITGLITLATVPLLLLLLPYILPS